MKAQGIAVTASDPVMECPSCKADLRGELIPEERREWYGGATHSNRVLGIYDRDLDMTVAWMCPDCGYRWDREGIEEEREEYQTELRVLKALKGDDDE